MGKFIMAALMAVAFAFASTAYAQTGPAKAQKPTPAQKLAPVLPAQSPQVSTGTKPSMVGVPKEQFQPPKPKMKTVAPPPPKR